MATKRKHVSSSTQVKATAIECEFCLKAFKPRGLKLHQNKCATKRPKRRDCCFELLGVDVLANVLSFLSNQSIVKLQSITSGRYPGSDALVSSICCSCENDELAIANGRCLACNQVKDPSFCSRVTTTNARRLYGIQDIGKAPHKRYLSPYRRGHYSLFEYEDMERFAQTTFGSKMAWLQMLAGKIQRRRKMAISKRKKEEEYRAVLLQFPQAFADYLTANQAKATSEQVVEQQAARYELLIAAFAKRNIENRPISYAANRYIIDGEGDADQIANARAREVEEREERRRTQEELNAFLKTLPSEFVKYLGRSTGTKILLAQQAERYRRMVDALTDRGVELRGDSVLCRNYIHDGSGRD